MIGNWELIISSVSEVKNSQGNAGVEDNANLTVIDLKTMFLYVFTRLSYRHPLHGCLSVGKFPDWLRHLKGVEIFKF